MKKIALFLVVFLPIFVFAENLYYYSNGKKITLAETSGYTFIDGRVTKNVTLPKNLTFALKHKNIYLFDKLTSENIKELKNYGRVYRFEEQSGRDAEHRGEDEGRAGAD